MKIGIAGLGLIGGSLGLDLRRQGHRVVAISRKAATCRRAVEIGAADEAGVDVSVLSGAEIVFLCTPLGVMDAVADEIIPALAPETILTDVGSVKGPVVESIGAKWANFVGGHPMAGTAENGIDAALENLFQNAPYVLTPTENTPKEAVSAVAQIAADLGSRVYTCSPQEHDQAVALISHLPVFSSASLIQACLGENDKSVLELAKRLASSGFRDASRVGGGNPELGVMMATFNKSALLAAMKKYRRVMDEFIDFIERENWDEIEKRLAENQAERSAFV